MKAVDRYGESKTWVFIIMNGGQLNLKPERYKFPKLTLVSFPNFYLYFDVKIGVPTF